MTSDVTAIYSLEKAIAGIRAYEEQMGTGKIVMQLPDRYCLCKGITPWT
jgi:hypothetical protein